jgi:uncharacterized protein YjbI with pentapeptide repeats
MTSLFKVIDTDGKGVDDALGYDLPQLEAPGPWMPGITDPMVGSRGYHLVVDPANHWRSGARLFAAEYRGAVDTDEDGVVAAESVRLTEEITPRWPLLTAFPVVRVLLAWAWRETHAQSTWPEWANLERINISRAALSGARLASARLPLSRLNQADLSGADLAGGNLQRANCRQSRLDSANLSEARLDYADLWAASLFRTDLQRSSLTLADLRRCFLREADLSGASLRNARLAGACLFRARLDGADFSGADLRHTVASGATLVRADLSDANLAGARLDGADLSEANLTGADLTTCDLTGARFLLTKGLVLPSGWALTEDGTAVRHLGAAANNVAKGLPGDVRDRLVWRRWQLAAEVPANRADLRAWVSVTALPESTDRFTVRYFEYSAEHLRYLRDNGFEFEEWRRLHEQDIIVIGERALEHVLRTWLDSLEKLVQPSMCRYPE